MAVPMILEISLLALVALTVAAIEMKDLLHAVIVLGATSTIMSLVFFLLAAPDIAITQAAVSGLTTLIFVVAISKTERAEHGSVSAGPRQARKAQSRGYCRRMPAPQARSLLAPVMSRKAKVKV